MPSTPDQHSKEQFIHKLESIAPLSNEERKAVESLPITVRAFTARQDIVLDGDKPPHCSLIIDGWAYSYKLLKDGKRQILAFHTPGDTPDLQSLHIPTIDHSIATIGNAIVAFISHESLRELVARHPGIATILWRDTLIDAAIFREWMIGIGRRTSFGHVAHLFCELYLKLHAVGLAEDHRCPLPITQADIADAVGITTVHVNRVLREMRGRTLITLKSHTLVIENWNELKRLAEFDPTYLQLEGRVAG